MQTALLLIAFQQNYFTKGAQKLKGAKSAAKAAAKVLSYYREKGLPVVHLLQTGQLEDISADKLQPYELLEPKQDELILLGNDADVFADGKLHDKLERLQVSQLMIAGLGTENEVLRAVLSGKRHGYAVQLIQDACATRALKFEKEKIEAGTVHKVLMATVANMEIKVLTAKYFVKEELKKEKKTKKATAKQEAILEAARSLLESSQNTDAVGLASSKSKKHK